VSAKTNKSPYTTGYWHFSRGDRFEAAHDYQSCLHLIDQATAAERAELIFDQMEDKRVTVGSELDKLGRLAKNNLVMLRGGTPEEVEAAMAAAAKERMENGDGHDSDVFMRNMGGNIGPLGDRAENMATLQEAMKRLAAGGDKCDACGVPALGGKPLKLCGRCKLAYFCSPAWRAGHKRACRAPGQFEVGDKVQVQSAGSHPEYDHQIVEVRGRTPGDDSRVSAALIGSDKMISFKPEELRRLRPTA